MNPTLAEAVLARRDRMGALHPSPWGRAARAFLRGFHSFPNPPAHRRERTANTLPAPFSYSVGGVQTRLRAALYRRQTGNRHGADSCR